MYVKKFFRRIIAVSMAAGAMIITPHINELQFMSTVQAAVQTYTGIGEAIIGDRDTMESAKNFAKQEAIRNAQEQAGFYLESYSHERDFELLKDEILTITSGTIQIRDVKYEVKVLDNDGGIKCTATVKAAIDPHDMEEWLSKKSMEQRLQVNSQYDDLRKIYKAQEARIKKLEQQLKASKKNSVEKQKLKEEYEKEDKILESSKKIEEGWQSWGSNDYSRAQTLFSEATKLDSTNANAYYGQGVAYENMKQYDNAINCFNKTIELNPNFAYAYNSRGKAYFSMHQNDNAIADFTRAIELNSSFDSAYNNRGYVYNELKQYVKASNDFSVALQINPNFPEARYNFAKAYSNLQEYEKAIIHFGKSIELKPNFAEAYNERGYAYFFLPNYEQAIEDFSKAIELKPNLAQAYFNRAVVYFKIDNFEAAINDASKYIDQNPTDANAYYTRALIYQKIFKGEKASADFEKAKELGFKFPED